MPRFHPQRRERRAARGPRPACIPPSVVPVSCWLCSTSDEGPPGRTPPAAGAAAGARAAPARSLVRDDDASLRQSQQPDAVVTGVSCSSATVPRAPTDVSPHGGSRASILDVGATTAGRQGRLHYRRQSRAVSVLRCVDAAAPSHMVGGRQLRVLARCCLRCFPHLTLTSFAAWVHAGSSRLSDIQG